MEFLNEQKIKGFSTAHAIVSWTDNIESAIDNKQFVSGVFIDLQKAFSVVQNLN